MKQPLVDMAARPIHARITFSNGRRVRLPVAWESFELRAEIFEEDINGMRAYRGSGRTSQVVLMRHALNLRQIDMIDALFGRTVRFIVSVGAGVVYTGHGSVDRFEGSIQMSKGDNLRLAVLAGEDGFQFTIRPENGVVTRRHGRRYRGG